jgi:hypothetical protein
MPRHSRPLPLPRQPVAAWAEASSAPQKIAFGIFTLYLFLSYSKLHEFVLGDFRIMMLLLPLLVLTTILAGGLPGAILSRLGILLCALTVWFCFATPFGFWPGGSFETLRTYWLPSLTMFMLTAGVVRTARQIRTAMELIAAGGVILAILTFVYPGSMAVSPSISDRSAIPTISRIIFCLPSPSACSPCARMACLSGRRSPVWELP